MLGCGVQRQRVSDGLQISEGVEHCVRCALNISEGDHTHTTTRMCAKSVSKLRLAATQSAS